ncbi:hypothetical protein GFC29_3728 [Anoxybacillus sp. B7M1]|jgi:hypothetical protein|uniref:Lipoprotein n=1 Tax=Anoxybacteroides rupiense TaxID=311460 RepID=A0ABD5J2E8_9BACL|nr:MULTISPECIES: hypothetical protein [Anoxybacillus]ANB56121.1 hypothetical protein GFC28_1706 [Anoxybacillus sp. B2M1]ANB63439.1 hypothetical protein GFC29_3728 [Anoxybacillus sp. B7M1]MED5053746.1 hypothetical protein [Anoxybacillus rupiensis]
MRKVIITVTLLSLFIFALTGCGVTSQKNDATSGESEQNKQSETTTKEQSKEHEAKKYYFTANEGGSISKIDLKTNKVVSTIKVDGAVHNVQVSPDGKILGATLVPEMQHGNDHSMEMKGMAVFIIQKQTN